MTQKDVLTGELLRMGFRGYGTGQVTVLMWYWRTGYVRGFQEFPWTATSLAELRSQLCERGYDMLMKRDAPKKRADSVLAGNDDHFSEGWPILYSHLTQVKWEDGTVRQPGSLLFFTGEGVWKGMLKDKENGLCLWASSSTFLGLLGVLEKAAGDPDAEWRVDRVQGAGTPAKRVKNR